MNFFFTNHYSKENSIFFISFYYNFPLNISVSKFLALVIIKITNNFLKITHIGMARKVQKLILVHKQHYFNLCIVPPRKQTLLAILKLVLRWCIMDTMCTFGCRIPILEEALTTSKWSLSLVGGSSNINWNSSSHLGSLFFFTCCVNNVQLSIAIGRY